MSASMRYFRSKDGSIVHLAGCRYVANSVPWKWAEGLPDAEVVATVWTSPWLRWCRYCVVDV